MTTKYVRYTLYTLRRIKGWVKGYQGLFIALLLTMTLFLGAQILTPHSSTIYFDGASDRAAFTLHPEEEAMYSITSDSYGNGRIQFRAGETDVIYAVSTAASEEVLQAVLSGEYAPSYWLSGTEVFPFVDGCGTISGEFGMTLTLAPGEDTGGANAWEDFIYDIEISRGKEFGSQEQNQIELKNFPKGMGIYLQSSHDLHMLGATVQMPTGNYRIIGCKSIRFDLAPLAAGTQDPAVSLATSLDHIPLEHFRFTNSERDILEVTYFAETKFSELGHVEVEGDTAEIRDLCVEVENLCQYPYPVKIYGRVGRLTMAGATCYPSWAQWLLDNRSELLRSIVLLFIGMVMPKGKGAKPD